MNTIKIRKEYPELVERIRSNVRAYRDFTQYTADHEGGSALYSNLSQSDLKEYYYDFIKDCFQEDIKELNELMKIENE